MSIFKSRDNKGTLGALTQGLRTALQTQGSDLGGRQAGSRVASFESLSDADRDATEISLQQAVRMIQDTATGVHFSAEAYDEAGDVSANASMQAAAIAAVASQNPSEYAQAALTSAAKPEQNVIVIDPELSGANGTIDTAGDQVSQEAYDERNLTDYSHYSIVYNLQASRQDAFGEAFFPTVTVSPEQGGLDITVQSLMVMNEQRHALSGRRADFNKRNLIDGFVDHTLLADEATKVVPFRLADDSNANAFVAETLVAPHNVSVAGVAITTAPLKINEEVDVLGLSSHPSLIGAGVMDNTDALDARMALSAIYVETSDGKALKFSTANLARTQFNKTPEGNYREVGLQFDTRDIVIDSATRAVDGTASLDLGAVAAGMVVRVAVTVTGLANLETGNVSVNAGKLRAIEIRDAAGNQVDLSAGAGATIAAAIAAMEVAGYDLEARRTNSNRRTRGTLLDTTYFVERYAVPVGSPLSIPRPVTNQRDAADLKALITATRIRNSNDAVTTLLNYADTLRAYVRGPKFHDQAPAIVGSGRHYVTPFYEEHELDMLEAINSVKSHEKAYDVSAVLVNAVRDIAYRMTRDSKYLPALQAISGGVEEQPNLLIGTDTVIERHLMVSGDTRTFGDSFKDFQVVQSPDRRMRDTIFITLSRKSAAAPDALSFGAMAWMPELTSAVDMQRNGALSREVMVQPRKLHIPLCPILAKITVKNLSAALADKIEQPAVAGPSDDSWSNGIAYP